jgi:hypothetical protein
MWGCVLNQTILILKFDLHLVEVKHGSLMMKELREDGYHTLRNQIIMIKFFNNSTIENIQARNLHDNDQINPTTG